MPHFLADEITRLLDGTPASGLLFPSPGRRARDGRGEVVRVDSGLYTYDNWRSRAWTPIAEATPGWEERDDWWPPEAVAKFLGHRSGVQVWEMYVRVRPNLFGRAATASRAVGDPRSIDPTSIDPTRAESGDDRSPDPS